MKNFCGFNAFLSMAEPKDHMEALREADWIIAMQEEQFQRNKV